MNERFFCKDKLLQDKVSFGMPNYKRMADWKKSVCMRGSAYLACASVNLCVLVSVCDCECACVWMGVRVCVSIRERVVLREIEKEWERDYFQRTTDRKFPAENISRIFVDFDK